MQRLLCVDDEVFILSSLTRLFKTQYQVLTASSALEALKVLSEHAVDVVVSDQRMPGMTGVELFRQVQHTSPHTMRILLTGYADLPATIEAVNSGEVFRYVTKPWNNDSLRMTVALAMRAAQKTHEHTQALQPAPRPVASASNVVNLPLRGLDLLVLDSDPSLATVIGDAFSEERQVFSARSLEEAAEQLDAHASIGVLITEARLGNDSLTHVLSSLRTLRPTLVTMVASRFADAQMVIQLINQGQIYRFIGKPVSPEKLKAEIGGAMRRHVQLRHMPALSDRHAVEIAKPIQETIAKHAVAAQGGGLKGLFSRVVGLFR